MITAVQAAETLRDGQIIIFDAGPVLAKARVHRVRITASDEVEVLFSYPCTPHVPMDQITYALGHKVRTVVT